MKASLWDETQIFQILVDVKGWKTQKRGRCVEVVTQSNIVQFSSASLLQFLLFVL